MLSFILLKKSKIQIAVPPTPLVNSSPNCYITISHASYQSQGTNLIKVISLNLFVLSFPCLLTLELSDGRPRALPHRPSQDGELFNCDTLNLTF